MLSWLWRINSYALVTQILRSRDSDLTLLWLRYHALLALDLRSCDSGLLSRIQDCVLVTQDLLSRDSGLALWWLDLDMYALVPQGLRSARSRLTLQWLMTYALLTLYIRSRNSRHTLSWLWTHSFKTYCKSTYPVFSVVPIEGRNDFNDYNMTTKIHFVIYVQPRNECLLIFKFICVMHIGKIY